MTLEDLDRTLPNGLHDARIRSLSHDYKSAVVKLEVEILFGLPADLSQDIHSLPSWGTPSKAMHATESTLWTHTKES
jgi:hypothetical protein